MADSGMKKIEQIRLRKIGNRIDEIASFIWHGQKTVTDFAYSETEKHLTFAEAVKLKYQKASEGLHWGSPWSTAWFRLRFTVPAEFRGRAVALLFFPEGECIVFRDGEAVQGIDPNHKEYFLTEKARGGEKFELYVEAGANEVFG